MVPEYLGRRRVPSTETYATNLPTYYKIMLTRLSVYIPRKSEKSTESRNKLRVLIERYEFRKGKRPHFNNTANSVGKTAVSNRARQIPEEKQRVATERHEIARKNVYFSRAWGLLMLSLINSAADRARALALSTGAGASAGTQYSYWC